MAAADPEPLTLVYWQMDEGGSSAPNMARISQSAVQLVPFGPDRYLLVLPDGISRDEVERLQDRLQHDLETGALRA